MDEEPTHLSLPAFLLRKRTENSMDCKYLTSVSTFRGKANLSSEKQIDKMKIACMLIENSTSKPHCIIWLHCFSLPAI
jgi:hypothetical protein